MAPITFGGLSAHQGSLPGVGQKKRCFTMQNQRLFVAALLLVMFNRPWRLLPSRAGYCGGALATAGI